MSTMCVLQCGSNRPNPVLPGTGRRPGAPSVQGFNAANDTPIALIQTITLIDHAGGAGGASDQFHPTKRRQASAVFAVSAPISLGVAIVDLARGSTMSSLMRRGGPRNGG